jgi:hypothetical protein
VRESATLPTRRIVGNSVIAKLLKVSAPRARKLGREKTVPGLVLDVGRVIRWDLDTVLEYLQRNGGAA